MPNNSIRDNLSKEDIIAEIRLTLSADIAHKKSIIIVEGQDDILFLNGKLDKDVLIEESFSGKLGVIEIVDFFADNRVIGICDSDYETTLHQPPIFYYDYCCLEMMIISCINAFSPFCNVYYSGNKTCEELRKRVLVDLLRLSMYRKKNTELSWGLNFKGLSFPKYYNKRTKEMEVANLDNDIYRINPGKSQAEFQAYKRIVTESTNEEYSLVDLYRITQGHDFINCYKTIISFSRKRHEPSESELFHCMVSSYHYENFSESQLFQTLSLYQQDNHLSILLN